MNLGFNRIRLVADVLIVSEVIAPAKEEKH
jgi:hypothetical protein